MQSKESGSLRKKFWRLNNTIAYRLADCFVTPTDETSEFARLKYLQERGQKSHHLHNNWIDKRFFERKISRSGSDRRAIFVGRLVKEKNVDLLIRFCIFNNLNLDIVGEGEERSNLADLISKSGGQLSINLMGSKTPGWLVENLPNYSYYASFPLSRAKVNPY